MVRLARNGVEMCWADEDVKEGILEELEKVEFEE
jgi:adenosine deaminase